MLTQRTLATAASAARNSTVIVTGAGRGIGRAIALRLARDGYDVCINDLPSLSKEAEDVATVINNSGRKACIAFADVSKPAEVDAMVQTSVKQLGPLNTMVANAGIAHVAALLDVTPAQFTHIFNVNVSGVQNCFSAAARQLLAQGNCTAEKPGKLIAAASIAAFRPSPLLGPYGATKWAVRGLTQTWARELAPHHITANCYAPGVVDTDMWDVIDSGIERAGGAGKERPRDDFVTNNVALGRLSTAEDVAGLVSFLAGRDADYVTGQTQVVDGGCVFT